MRLKQIASQILSLLSRLRLNHWVRKENREKIVPQPRQSACSHSGTHVQQSTPEGQIFMFVAIYASPRMRKIALEYGAS